MPTLDACCSAWQSGPEVIRKWHIPNPYDAESCFACDQVIAKGDLIDIEFEGGVRHADCQGS